MSAPFLGRPALDRRAPDLRPRATGRRRDRVDQPGELILELRFALHREATDPHPGSLTVGIDPDPDLPPGAVQRGQQSHEDEDSRGQHQGHPGVAAHLEHRVLAELRERDRRARGRLARGELPPVGEIGRAPGAEDPRGDLVQERRVEPVRREVGERAFPHREPDDGIELHEHRLGLVALEQRGEPAAVGPQLELDRAIGAGGAGSRQLDDAAPRHREVDDALGRGVAIHHDRARCDHLAAVADLDRRRPSEARSGRSRCPRSTRGGSP